MSKNVSQIVADLFAKPANGAGLPSQARTLGDELKKAVQSEETIYGKFRGLLESFREIIPDEQQRYQAALKALSTTAKLSRQEITKAIDEQAKDLKVVEKGFLPAQAGWRNELKAMENRAQQLKGEIAQLREKVAQLESEEKGVLAAKASREKELEQAEQTVKDVFAGIGTELIAFKKKLEELPAESAGTPPGPTAAAQAPSPVPPSMPAAPSPAPQKKDASSKKKESREPAIEIQGAAVTAETQYQRKCPMCGGPFNLLELENKWQCFTCGHEEAAIAAPEQKAAAKQGENQPGSKPAAPADTNFQRKCPMCGGPFNLLELEKKWQCYTCAHEEPAAG